MHSIYLNSSVLGGKPRLTAPSEAYHIGELVMSRLIHGVSSAIMLPDSGMSMGEHSFSGDLSAFCNRASFPVFTSLRAEYDQIVN